MKIEPTETEIQASILQYLQIKHILAWRCQAVPVPIRRGREIVGLRAANRETIGIPDILCVIHGKLLGIEVKKPGQKLRPEQIVWRDKLKMAGADSIVAYSVSDVIAYLRNTFRM